LHVSGIEGGAQKNAGFTGSPEGKGDKNVPPQGTKDISEKNLAKNSLRRPPRKGKKKQTEKKEVSLPLTKTKSQKRRNNLIASASGVMKNRSLRPRGAKKILLSWVKTEPFYTKK